MTDTPKEDTPMGVSQWMNHGRKWGYWEYFEKEAAGLREKELYIIAEAEKRREKELYIIAETVAAQGWTMERYLTTWGIKMALNSGNGTNKP